MAETIRIIVTESGAIKASRSVSAIGKSASTSLLSVNSLRAGLATLGLAFLARELVRYTDAWRLAGNRIRLVTRNQEEFNAVQIQLVQVAKETRTSLAETVELYQRMGRTIDQLDASQQELVDITETVNQAMIISGASVASMKAALIQLGQGFAAGALRGQELNAVMEQTPRLARAIADGMGVTIGQLRLLGEEGKLTAKAVFQSLQSQAVLISKEFKTIVPTVGQALTVLKTGVTEYIGKVNEALGVTRLLSNVIIVLGDNIGILITVLATVGGLLTVVFSGVLISSISKVVLLIRRFALAFGTAATTGGLFFGVIAKQLRIFDTFITSSMSVSIVLSNISRLFLTGIGIVRTFGIAIAGLGGSLLSIAPVVGLIGVLIGVFILFSDEIKEATRSLTEFLSIKFDEFAPRTSKIISQMTQEVRKFLNFGLSPGQVSNILNKKQGESKIPEQTKATIQNFRLSITRIQKMAETAQKELTLSQKDGLDERLANLRIDANTKLKVIEDLNIKALSKQQLSIRQLSALRDASGRAENLVIKAFEAEKVKIIEEANEKRDELVKRGLSDLIDTTRENGDQLLLLSKTGLDQRLTQLRLNLKSEKDLAIKRMTELLDIARITEDQAKEIISLVQNEILSSTMLFEANRTKIIKEANDERLRIVESNEKSMANLVRSSQENLLLSQNINLPLELLQIRFQKERDLINAQEVFKDATEKAEKARILAGVSLTDPQFVNREVVRREQLNLISANIRKTAAQKEINAQIREDKRLLALANKTTTSKLSILKNGHTQQSTELDKFNDRLNRAISRQQITSIKTQADGVAKSIKLADAQRDKELDAVRTNTREILNLTNIGIIERAALLFKNNILSETIEQARVDAIVEIHRNANMKLKQDLEDRIQAEIRLAEQGFKARKSAADKQSREDERIRRKVASFTKRFGTPQEVFAVDVGKIKALQGSLEQTEKGLAITAETANRAINESYRQMLAGSRVWVDGAKIALLDYADSAQNAAFNAQRAFTNAFNNMEDALVEFLTTGELSFAKFADSILRDLNRIFVSQNITGPLAEMLFGTAKGGGLSSLGSFFGSGGTSSPIQAFDNGGVNTKPGLFASTVPEAHIPLDKLNKFMGQSSQGTTIINAPVTIQTNDPKTFVTHQDQIAARQGSAIRRATRRGRF